MKFKIKIYQENNNERDFWFECFREYFEFDYDNYSKFEEKLRKLIK